MGEDAREKRKKWIWLTTGLLTGVSVLVMYMTHRHVPFMMDDLWYSTILSDESVPIASLWDIVRSQVWHYQNWGGRSITHGILQLTLLAGEQAANLLNVGMTLLLSWAACVVADEKKLPFFFGGMAMMLGLNANWKMSMFWQAGAANYLYITVVILIFVACYLRELSDGKERASDVGEGRMSAAETVKQGLASDAGEGRRPGREQTEGKNSKGRWHRQTAREGGRQERTERKNLPGILLWIAPLGLLAGWSNENMGPAVWILSLAVILCTGKEKGRVPLWMILGNLFCLAGSAMVIAAPGNFVRSAQVPDREYGLLWRIFLRGYAESRAALEYLFPTLLILALVLIVGKGALKIEIGRRNRLLLFCALLSWGAMFLSPHYPDRAAFGTMLLLICVILSMTGKIIRKRGDLSLPFWGLSLLVWLRGMYFCGEFLSICWGWIR